MTDITATDAWTDANQRYLLARLALVRDALQRRADGDRSAEPSAALELAVQAARDAMPAPAALDALGAAFELSPFELDLLVLCAGVELDAAFAELCASHGRATFGLGLAALPEPHWSALTPAGPLRRWRLLEVAQGESLTTSALRIDERVLHHLTGIAYLDDRLHGAFEPVPAQAQLPDCHAAIAQRVLAIWQQPEVGPGTVVHLAGNDLAARQAVAASACAARGLRLCVVAAADLPTGAAERETMARLWEREAMLSGRACLLDAEDVEDPRPALAWLRRVRGFVLFGSRTGVAVPGRAVVRIEVDRPPAAEQMRLWRQSLGPVGLGLNGELEHLVAQFDLDAGQIHAASALAAGAPAERGRDLWHACRVHARGRLDALAQRIDPAAAWEDLVLPLPQMQTLREITAQVRHRTRVYDTWGFASKGARGLGISALFAGQSGTGKTMAAEVLAAELELDLYRIDLSQVVSKYIGETEKNLRRVFDAAESGGAVLLFDEADALFGKRSEVRDSHDRYANIEVSYLLQRMESYRGLAILTTNVREALDTAFLRRIRFVLEFPFPDATQREEIWRRVYPTATPLLGVEPGKLARLNVAGGNIRNIAVQAAFLAAHGEQAVTMRHLLQAARREYAKLDKTLTDSETRDWV